MSKAWGSGCSPFLHLSVHKVYYNLSDRVLIFSEERLSRLEA